jgi:hypothetical protein
VFFRWAVRGILLLGFVLIVLATVVSWDYWHWSTNQETARELVARGIDVRWEHTKPVWTRLTGGKGDFLGDRVARIIDTRGSMTDADVQKCAGLRELRGLTSWPNSEITGTGLKDIGEIRSLRELTLYSLWTADLDSWLGHMGKLSNLQKLNLSASEVSDSGLLQMTGLRSLRSLDLARTHVTDEGIAEIPRLFPALEELHLVRTDITDASLKAVCEMKSLTHLDLGETLISDASVQYLSRMSKLTELELRSTMLSKNAVVDLQRALPSTRIDFIQAGFMADEVHVQKLPLAPGGYLLLAMGATGEDHLVATVTDHVVAGGEVHIIIERGTEENKKGWKTATRYVSLGGDASWTDYGRNVPEAKDLAYEWIDVGKEYNVPGLCVYRCTYGENSGKIRWMTVATSTDAQSFKKAFKVNDVFDKRPVEWDTCWNEKKRTPPIVLP